MAEKHSKPSVQESSKVSSETAKSKPMQPYKLRTTAPKKPAVWQSAHGALKSRPSSRSEAKPNQPAYKTTKPTQKPQKTTECEPSTSHKSQPIKDWEKPRLFIETDDKGKLFVNKETEQCLLKISKPVVVVSVVGLYRTGKSFILNRLSGLGQGFSLGATVESTTKGIWIWVVKHPKWDDRLLVLVDTEGLGDMDKAELNHDTWIFALGILLSGTFVYNSKGAIDQKAMNELHLVTEIAEHIKVKPESEKDVEVHEGRMEQVTSSSTGKYEELKEFFPSFVWTLRDFTLKLEISGKACSPDEYLEHALTQSAVKPKARDQGEDVEDLSESAILVYDRQTATKKIHPKDCIKEYFHERRCFVFPFPVKDLDLMGVIDTLEDEYFHKDFLRVTNEFCEFIFTHSKVKTVYNNITTGRGLARLAAIYVESIRSGKAPCIQNAFDLTAKFENEKAIKECVDLYTKEFEEAVTFPTETLEKMAEIHSLCSEKAFKSFLTKSTFDSKRTYYEQLKNKVEEAYEQFRNTNEMKSAKACGKLLSDLYEKISTTDYLFSGGYKKYEEDMKQLIEDYNKACHFKDVAAHILLEFTTAKEETRQLILKADDTLSKADKAEEELRAAKKAKEIAETANEEGQRRIKLLEAEQKKSNEQHFERLMAKTEEERNIRGTDDDLDALEIIKRVVGSVGKSIAAMFRSWFN